MSKGALDSDFEFILHNAKASFEKLRDSSIFITGATGFFGKWLLGAFRHASDYNIKVYALSRNPESFKEKFPELSKGIIFIKGDVRDFKFPDILCDYIIHAATAATQSEKLLTDAPEEMIETIVKGTKHIINFSKKANTKRILHTSSGAVYGDCKGPKTSFVEEDFSGDTPGKLLNVYAQGKRESEALGNLFAKSSSCDWINARCFAFSGPYLPMDAHYAFGNFMQNIIDEEEMIIKGDGTALRSYMYPADLIIWLLKILTDGKNCEAYNVGSDEIVSIEDLAKKICFKANKIKADDSKVNFNYVVLEKARENNNPHRYLPHIKKPIDKLGLKIFTSLDDIIEKNLRFLYGN